MIPEEIDGAKLLYSVILDERHRRTGNTEHWVGGEQLTEIYALAICQYDEGNGVYLFYCNSRWQSFTDTWHETIEDAKDQGEFEFEGTMNTWVNHSSQ